LFAGPFRIAGFRLGDTGCTENPEIIMHNQKFPTRDPEWPPPPKLPLQNDEEPRLTRDDKSSGFAYMFKWAVASWFLLLALCTGAIFKYNPTDYWAIRTIVFPVDMAFLLVWQLIAVIVWTQQRRDGLLFSVGGLIGWSVIMLCPPYSPFAVP
jgi:hypothetical protein